jgi:4'-phosphopantetheinyl transferase
MKDNTDHNAPEAQELMQELSTGQIHLWFVFVDEIRDEHLLNRYRLLLTDEERQQELRFYFARDRHRYLVTRALVRTVLSRYAPVAPERWSFSANMYGRPEITDDDAREISFNISHTQGLIILGIAKGIALGVDTENVTDRRVSSGVAERFFSRAEASALRDLPMAAQHERFFDYWTLKESYIKAHGMGLSIPLNQFSFHFPSDRQVKITIDAELNDHASRWRFWQLRPSTDHLVAVCAERSTDAEPRLIMKKLVPWKSEATFDCALLRKSD